jgi:2,4-dienoyl-CoA reductase (NADPH2)
VIIGGGQVGCELGEFLIEQGKKITIIEMLPQICADVEMLNRKLLMKRLAEMQPTLITDAEIVQIDKEKVIYLDEKKKENTLSCEAVILAAGYRPDEDLIISKRYSAIESHFIGDCQAPRGIYAAIMEGNHIGLRI